MISSLKGILAVELNIFLTLTVFSQNIVKIGGVDDPARIGGVRIDSVKSLSGFPNGFTTVKDIDGNVYKTVKIGNQIWMAEDLKVTHYPNGDPIPYTPNDTIWADLEPNNTDDAYCFYNNDNNSDYGALYTYAAAIGDNWERDNNPNQGICPDGWHLPTDAEWTTLFDYLGGRSVAGGKMKETGTYHWKSPNLGADNSSGFSAIPGGRRLSILPDFGETFGQIGEYCFWWSSTEDTDVCAFQCNIYYYSEGVSSNAYYDKSNGFYVRCVKD